MVFIGIIGGTPDKRISEGNPDKRISECVFSFYFFLINVFLRVYFALCFFDWLFIGIFGGTPDKRSLTHPQE